jgi:hypothetical protein
MKWIHIVAGLGLCAILAGANAAPAGGPVIHIEDVARFYQVYNAAHGHPTADQLQHDYLDPGSDGLHRFAKERNTNGARIADTLAKHPEIYTDAARCMDVLPRVRTRLALVFGTLRRLNPEAQFPPVTIAIGRGKPVGITDATGVMIGLESLCATSWLNPDVEERFVHVIAHEYGHAQQALKSPAFYDDEKPTVLQGALIEGAAEFVSEMTSGEVAYGVFAKSTKGREKEIETAFVADEDKTDLSGWFNNSTLEKPGDLGYWVGYRIVKSYYEHATDKRRAFREILEMKDAKAFLAKSGWFAGMEESR